MSGIFCSDLTDYAEAKALLTTDLESSEEEEDVPLHVLASSRSAPPALARVTSLTEKSTHVEDFQDTSNNGEESGDHLSDDDVDPEAHEQAVAEQSESDDEVVASMEACGDTEALGAYLAAEVSVVCSASLRFPRGHPGGPTLRSGRRTSPRIRRDTERWKSGTRTTAVWEVLLLVLPSRGPLSGGTSSQRQCVSPATSIHAHFSSPIGPRQSRRRKPRARESFPRTM